MPGPEGKFYCTVNPEAGCYSAVFILRKNSPSGGYQKCLRPQNAEKDDLVRMYCFVSEAPIRPGIILPFIYC